MIGQRWKALPPDRLTKYSELASEDTERYKKEMQAYNGRQEAKMRDESAKSAQSYPLAEAPKQSSSGRQAYDMNQMSPGSYPPQAPSSALGYGYATSDPYGYPSSLASAYQYGSYPGYGMAGMPPEAHPDSSTAAMYGGGYGYPPQGPPSYSPMDGTGMYGGYGAGQGWNGQP